MEFSQENSHYAFLRTRNAGLTSSNVRKFANPSIRNRLDGFNQVNVP